MSFFIIVNMANICRPIMLFNNYLPADNKRNDWDYCAYGIVDGISIGENIFDNGQNCVAQSILNYKKECDKKQSTLNRYSVQVLFAMGDIDENQENEFWNNDSDYPFFLLCRIQFMKSSKSDILAEKTKITKNLDFCDEVRLLSYMTFDNSDLLVAIKARTYEAGAGVVNKMHGYKNGGQDFLKNSFTIWAVKHAFVDKMSDEIWDKLNEIRIEEVDINIITKTSDGINKIMSELEERKKSFNKHEKIMIDYKHILGINDETIIIKNIGWGDFLSLYHRDEEKGVFCNCNQTYKEYISGSTTEIRTPLKQYNYEFDQDMKGLTGDRDEEEINDYLKQIEELEDLLKGIERGDEDAGYRELRTIIRVLSKYSESIFNDYTFFGVLPSLKALLKIIENHISLCINETFVSKYYFFEYLKGFIMYIQNSSKMDRHSMQVLDFNVKLYDIPVKITAFYNAYIYRVKKVLNSSLKGNKDIDYEFLMVPAIGDIVQVMEIYPNVSQKFRVMKIEVPEESYYNVKCLMIILAHEMAHYVGREYRNREFRYSAIIQSYSHVYLEYMKKTLGSLTDWSAGINKEKWEIIQSKLNLMIKNGMEQFARNDFLKSKYPELNEESRVRMVREEQSKEKHFRRLKPAIESTMMDIWQYAIEDIFIPILFDIEEVEKQKRIKAIKSITERFIIDNKEKNTILNSTNVLLLLEQLYEECFADLMSILILGIDINEYMECFLVNAEQQKITCSVLMKSDAIARMAFVIYCNSDRDDFGTKEALQKIEKNVDKKRIFDCVYKYLEKHIVNDENTGESSTEENYGQRVINALNDNAVFENMIQYLKICQESFTEIYDSGNIKDEIDKIRHAFTLFNSFEDDNEVSIEKQILQMVKFIEGYKISFFNDTKYEERLNID